MQQGFMAEKVLGFEQIANVAASVGFTAARLTSAEQVEVSVEGQAVRWRADGTDPTAAVGMQLAVGASRVFTMQQLAAVRFIEVVAGAKLNCTYYGR